MFVYILRNGNCGGLMLHILIFNIIVQKVMVFKFMYLSILRPAISIKRRRTQIRMLPYVPLL